MDVLLARNEPSLWKGLLPALNVQRHYLWKSFRTKPNSIRRRRKVFGFRPESCSPSCRNRVRNQPGTLFGFTPETRSPWPGIPSKFLMIVLILTAIVVLALVAATVMLIRTMGSGGHSLPVTAEWISDLSIESYKPMLRLLDSADIEFLRGQPGYTWDMESKLRAQRC